MSVHLTVEEHLRVVTAYLTTVKAAANLVDQPTQVPGFAQPSHFAKWVADVVIVIDAHVGAVRAVLPAPCVNLDAPFVSGGER
jgi:hypothetical protein